MQFIKQTVVFLTVIVFSSAASFSWADDPHSSSSTAPVLSTLVQAVQPLDLNLPFKGLNNYSQNFADWGVQLDPNYDQSIQIKNPQIQDTVRQHYFGENSVWEEKSGEKIAKQVADILAFEKRTILPNLGWDNPEKQDVTTGYDLSKITELEENMDLDQFSASYQYDPSRRAITVQNANTRLLPTNQGYYKDNKAPGEGANFEYIQNSATWAGTPVYILGYSKDKAWDLVWTPDCIGWVEADKVATVNETFINKWKDQTKNKGLIGIINPEINIADKEDGKKQFLGYVGMILPLNEEDSNGFTVMIPVKNSSSGEAEIHYADLFGEDAVKIPYLPTPRHFVTLIQHQLGRPFDWGGGHPYGWNKELFYNDASSEMKYLFTVFGIYLPRHSTDQIDPSEVSGRLDDFTNVTVTDDATGEVTTRATNVNERIEYLQKNGHPFMTVIGGLALYLGNYVSSSNHTKEALAYQNIFGITPSQESRSAGKDVDRRAVVSKSLILPLLASYPEDSNLSSFIGRNGYFKLMYLDDVAPVPMTLMALPNAQKPVDKKIDIKVLMSL